MLLLNSCSTHRVSPVGKTLICSLVRVKSDYISVHTYISELYETLRWDEYYDVPCTPCDIVYARGRSILYCTQLSERHVTKNR